MKKILLFICLSLVVLPAFSLSSTLGGKVTHIASVNDAILFQVVGGSHFDRPSCASSKRYSVHKDSSHASVILTAFATGKPINQISGKGTCDLWGNSEDMYWVEICHPYNGCE